MQTLSDGGQPVNSARLAATGGKALQTNGFDGAPEVDVNGFETEGRQGDEGGVYALVADLIFASRIRAAAAAEGVRVETVTTSNALIEAAHAARPRLILVDLAARGVDPVSLIGALKADSALASVPIVAFGPHVDADLLVAAREAGADRVLARSAFVRLLPSLLAGRLD